MAEPQPTLETQIANLRQGITHLAAKRNQDEHEYTQVKTDFDRLSARLSTLRDALVRTSQERSKMIKDLDHLLQQKARVDNERLQQSSANVIAAVLPDPNATPEDILAPAADAHPPGAVAAAQAAATVAAQAAQHAVQAQLAAQSERQHGHEAPKAQAVPQAHAQAAQHASRGHDTAGADAATGHSMTAHTTTDAAHAPPATVMHAAVDAAHTHADAPQAPPVASMHAAADAAHAPDALHAPQGVATHAASETAHAPPASASRAAHDAQAAAYLAATADAPGHAHAAPPPRPPQHAAPPAHSGAVQHGAPRPATQGAPAAAPPRAPGAAAPMQRPPMVTATPAGAKPPPRTGSIQDRAKPRVPLAVEVDFSSENNLYVGFSEDISEGGLFVATFNPRPVGDKLSVQFTLPGQSQPLTCEMVVAWSVPMREDGSGQAGMGLRFVNLNDADRKALTQFIAQREPLFFPGEA